MTKRADVSVVHMWVESDGTYAVSLMDREGDELKCVGGSADRGGSWALAIEHADKYGVDAIEQDEHGQEIDRHVGSATHYAAGLARLRGTELADGDVVYLAAEDSTHCRVTRSAVEALGEALADDVDGTAYSEWCATYDGADRIEELCEALASEDDGPEAAAEIFARVSRAVAANPATEVADISLAGIRP